MVDVVELGVIARVDQLEKAGRAFDQVGAKAKNAQNAFDQTAKATDRVNASAQRATNTMRNLLAAFVGFQTVRKYIDLSDSFTNMESKIRLVTRSTEELVTTEKSLLKIANDNRAELSATTTLFGRMARSREQLGRTNQELLRVTDLVNKSLRISGASGAEASAGVIQLSQALASGTLRGDELRSVLENMPRLAESIALGLGKSVGALRKLGEEGKLTSRELVDAILKDGARLDSESAQIATTIGGAFTVLNNNLTMYIGELNKGTGASGIFANAILLVAENVDKIVKAFGALAVLGVPLLLNSIAGAASALWVIMAANPIGALVTVVGVVVTGLYNFRKELGLVRDTAEDFKPTADKLIENYTKLITERDSNSEALAKETEELRKNTEQHLLNQYQIARTEQADAKARVDKYSKRLEGATTGPYASGLDAIMNERNARGLATATKDLEQYNKEVAKTEELLYKVSNAKGIATEKLNAESKAREVAAAKAKALADAESKLAAQQDIQEYLDQLKQEVKLAGMTTDIREREAAIYELHNRLKKKNLVLDQQTAQEVRDLITERQRLTKEMEEQEELNKKILDGITGPLKEGMSGFFSGSNEGFSKMLDGWGKSVTDFLAEMATKQFVLPMVASFANANGLTGIANAAAQQGGFSLSSVSNLSSLSGIADMFGFGSTVPGGFGALNTFGNSYLGTGLPGLAGGVTSASLTSVLSGAGIGSLAASLFGLGNKNPLVSGAAGLAGSFAGSALLTPILGPFAPLAGGFLGSALSGLFGKKPSSKLQSGTVDLMTGNIVGRSGLGGTDPNNPGKKFSLENYNSVTDLSKVAGDLAKALGGINQKLVINVGNRDGTQFQLGDGPMQSFSDAKGFAGGLIKALSAAAPNVTEAFKGAIEKIDFSDMEKALADVNFAFAFDDAFGDLKPINALKEQMDALKKTFDEYRATAQRLGLDIEKVNAAEQRQQKIIAATFNQGIERSILQLTDPKTLAAVDIMTETNALLIQAASLGLDSSRIFKLQQLRFQDLAGAAEQASKDIQTSAGAFKDVGTAIDFFTKNTKSLEDALFRLRTGDNSIISPQDQLQIAKDRFNGLASDVQGGRGDLVPDLIQAGEELKRIALIVEGTGGDYTQIFRSIESTLEGARIQSQSEAQRLISLQNQQLAAAQQTNTILSDLANKIVAAMAAGAAGSDSSLLRANDTTDLNAINQVNLLPERLVRSFKSSVGFDFNAPENANRTFAEWVRAGHAAQGAQYNQMIAAAGGVTQQFAMGGITPMNQMFSVGERGREFQMSGSPSVVFSANQTRRMLDVVDMNINKRMVMSLELMREQMAAQSREMIQLLADGNFDRKAIKQNSRRRSGNVTGV